MVARGPQEMAASGGGAAGGSKPQKARRKISLPWFRQGSVTPPHPQLTRQHTIDTPGSFQARLLRRQPSHHAMVGISPPPSPL